MEMDLSTFGWCMIVASLIGLAVIRHMSVTAEIVGWHDALYSDPLTATSSRVLRRHIARPCATCSFHAELRSSVRIT